MANRGLDLESAIPAFDPTQGKNHLLVVGIDHYEHWPVLHNAVRDAQTFARVLCQQYQFEAADVVELFNEAASEGGIYRALRDLKRGMGPHDSLIIYYSGHGYFDQDFDEGYWVPQDARKGAEETYISNANILKRINALDGQHILMIVDSCFSGALLSSTRNASVDEHFPSRRVICSGRLEVVSDGAPGKHSPFADLLISRLRDNTNPSLNTTTLVQYVKEHIPKLSQQAPVDGRLQNSSDRGGEFIFHLKVSEEDLWSRVENEGTVQAFESYLNDYPGGKFANRASQQLLLLREDAIWENAQQKDNELAYRNYLRQYAGHGKYLEAAQRQLDALEARQEDRRKVLEQLANRDAEREGIREQYQALVNEAENRFQKEEMEAAREKYRESLQFFMAGFAPDYHYIEEQINLCTNGMAFVRSLHNGKAAMNRSNYRLALQYFNEAAQHGDDPKLEDLIRVCRQRLNPAAPKKQPEAAYAAAPNRGGTVTTPPRKQKQSYGGTLLKWLGGFALVFIILAIIGNLLPEEEAYTDQSYTTPVETQPQNTADPGPGSTASAPKTNTTKAAPTFQDLILGDWAVEDIVMNGQSLSDLAGQYNTDFSQYIYTFYNNGQVSVYSPTGTEQQTYAIDGQNIYLYSSVWGGSPGAINYIRSSEMQLTFYVADGFGGSTPMVVTFFRD
ncbi:MAG: caspase family protein [Phaeodactylibacter sp.]|uniref:caspase family protein n=1 Tax=Phaeodactylibacter sp. TaxID=1940289 RepID=UPI0032EE6381